MSLRWLSRDEDSESSTYDQSSQSVLARIINKLVLKGGTQSLLSRMLRGKHNLGRRGTLLLDERKRTDDKRTMAQAGPTLFSGFAAVLRDKGAERTTPPRQHGSEGGDDAGFSMVSIDRFEEILDNTPKEHLCQVLQARRSEYNEYLRHLEKERKDAVAKLRKIDDCIMVAIDGRKVVDERLDALKNPERGNGIDSDAIDATATGSTRDSAEEKGAHGEGHAKNGGKKPKSDPPDPKKATVNDASDDEGKGHDSDDQLYEQDDVPRLRKLQKVFRGHYGGITSIDYDSVQGLVATGSLDTQVKLWDVDTGDCKYTINGHSDIIRSVQFYERYLITGSNDGRMRMWDLSLFDSVQPQPSTKILREEYVPKTRRNVPKQKTAGIDDDLDADGRSADYDSRTLSNNEEADGDNGDGSAEFWTAKTIQTLQSTTPLVSPTLCRYVPPLELCCENTFVGHKDAVTCFQANNGTLISGSADKTLKEWDLSTGALRQAIDVAWATNDSTTRVSASRLPGNGSDMRGTDDGNGGFIGALQFYQFALATGTADGVLRLWDLRTAQVHRNLPGHTQPITSLQFDEHSILSGSLDGMALLWDLRSGRVLEKLRLSSPVTSVQLAPSHKRASYSAQCWIASMDGELHRWRSDTMQHTSYASDFGVMDRRALALGIGIDRSAGKVARVRAPESSVLISGDDLGVVKMWQV